MVRGFGRESIALPNVQYVDNLEFASTYELYSLNLAGEQLKGSIILSFGDILFRKYILQNLLAHPGEIVIAVDAAWKDRKRKDEYLDYVTASHPYTARYGEEEAELRDIGPKISKIDGEWIGLLKASPGGTDKIRETLTELSAQKNFRAMRCDALLRELVKKGVRVSIVYITGHWLDVDNLDDLSAANATAGI